jgi:hypothetical protein
MKPRSLLYGCIGIGAAILVACALPWFNRLNRPQPSPAPPTPRPSEPFQPESRVIPLSIEGQPTEVELKLFNPPDLPLTTYFPAKDFQSEVQEANGAKQVRFSFSPTGQKDPKAYLQIVLPESENSLAQVQELLVGDRGIMATNGWELVDRTDVVSYPWAKEKLLYQYQTSDGLTVGSIYLGENKGKAFYILTHYPAEYGDGFEPRSAIILENLQFKE